VVRDLEAVGRLADENLVGTWVGLGRHGGTVDEFGGCSFVVGSVDGVPASCVLQASEMGAPVYRQMGFVDVGRYVQLQGPPSA
jgi:hypothetical protein